MFQPPLGKPWLLYIILGSSLALNLVMVLDRPSPDEDGDDELATAAGELTADGEVTALAAATTDELPTATAVATPVPDGWRVTHADVEHSLARTFQHAVGDEGDALAAAYARLFVWDLDLRRDLQKGDRVEVLWRPDPDGVVEVMAARFHSRKLGTLEAWKWQPPGEAFASYWNSDGTGIERRLRGGPISEYQQITALLKDRPKHKGMDFKAPVGSDVLAPASATVSRTNWNWAANGNCVELEFDDGHVAKLLHLSENLVEPGQRVAVGQVIAKSGNTGRSTAPHLHYELHKGDKVVDPLDYHSLDQQQLTGTHLVSFDAERARMSAMLDQSVATR